MYKVCCWVEFAGRWWPFEDLGSEIQSVSISKGTGATFCWWKIVFQRIFRHLKWTKLRISTTRTQQQELNISWTLWCLGHHVQKPTSKQQMVLFLDLIIPFLVKQHRLKGRGSPVWCKGRGLQSQCHSARTWVCWRWFLLFVFPLDTPTFGFFSRCLKQIQEREEGRQVLKTVFFPKTERCGNFPQLPRLKKVVFATVTSQSQGSRFSRFSILAINTSRNHQFFFWPFF